MSRVALWFAMATLVSTPLFARAQGTGDAATQADEAADPEVLAKVEKYIDLAMTGRMPVRPQAAKRLVGLGQPALKRLVEECGENGAGMAAMGQPLVEVLGEFDDPRLRELLWAKLRDLDFPWRGAAARSLGSFPRTEERAAIWKLFDDHLAPVRVAALETLGRLGEPSDEERRELAARLARESNDRVRRAGVCLLDDWGMPGYLIWLVEDLRRTDKYFRLSFGEEARFQSARVLKERLGDLFGYRADTSPDDPENAAAIAKLEARATERAGGHVAAIPVVARAGRAIEGNVIGLELRSCRLGEFFLRWNRADVLLVGTGMPLEIQLEAGSVARLEAALAKIVAELGDERYWGDAGCDIEQLRLVGESGIPDNFLVSKGQARIPDLRPDPLDRAVALLVDSLPKFAGPELAEAMTQDERGHELRRNVEQALRAIGGDF